jgi:hypothetical protein
VAEHDIAGKVHRLAAGEKPAHLDHAVGVLARVQVGAADAAGERLDQHLSRARLRLGQRVDDDLAVPENSCSHLCPPLHSQLTFALPQAEAEEKAGRIPPPAGAPCIKWPRSTEGSCLPKNAI